MNLEPWQTSTEYAEELLCWSRHLETHHMTFARWQEESPRPVREPDGKGLSASTLGTRHRPQLGGQ